MNDILVYNVDIWINSKLFWVCWMPTLWDLFSRHKVLRRFLGLTEYYCRFVRNYGYDLKA
jgi:hypothetical protein